MKIKILIADDEQKEIDAIIGALIPVDGIKENDSSRIQLAKNNFDIRTFKVPGAAIYEIMHEGYRPDIALIDINFSNLQQSDLDKFPKNYNLILSKEKGIRRGRDFENEIKNISPKTLIRNITYIGNADESTFGELLSGKITPKLKNLSSDVNKMGEVGKAVIPMLQKVIIDKLNENQTAKKRVNEWVDGNFPSNKKLILNGININANDFLIPWLSYKYESGEIIQINTRLSHESFENAIFPKKMDLDWKNLKFKKGLMKQLNKKGILQDYYNHFNFTVLSEEIDSEATQFLEEFLDWFFNNSNDSFTPDININNLQQHLRTTKDLPDNHYEFTFDASNALWTKLQTLFIVQRIICCLSATVKEGGYDENLLTSAVPYLRQTRLGSNSAIDFINKLGLSQDGNIAKYQLPYVMPDTAIFVAEYMKKRQNSD